MTTNFDPVSLHSDIASKFDQRYLTSIPFRDRLEKWNRLIDKWVEPGANVLDAGCGSGVLTAHLTKIADTITALDAAPEMLEIAQKKFTDEELQKITFRNHLLPLDNDFPIYDVILCSSVLEYLDDMDKTLRSFHEHLAPSGKMIFSFPNRYSPIRIAEPIAYRLLKKPSYYPYMANKPCSPSSFSKRLEKIGFKTIDRSYCGRSMPFKIQVMEFTLPLFILVAEKI